MRTTLLLLCIASTAFGQVRGNFIAKWGSGAPVLPSIDLKYQDGTIRVMRNQGDSVTVPNIKGGWQLLSYVPDTTCVIQILTTPAKMQQLINNDTLIYLENPDSSVVEMFTRRPMLYAQSGKVKVEKLGNEKEKKPIDKQKEKKIKDKLKECGRKSLENETFPDDSTLVEKVLKAHKLDKVKYKAQGLGR